MFPLYKSCVHTLSYVHSVRACHRLMIFCIPNCITKNIPQVFYLWDALIPLTYIEFKYSMLVLSTEAYGKSPPSAENGIVSWYLDPAGYPSKPRNSFPFSDTRVFAISIVLY